MSVSLMPELLRKRWYALSFGKACFFWSSNDRLTSASATLIPSFPASCWTHWAWIRNCMTSPLSWSYCCLHCFFSWASLGCFAPLGVGCDFWADTQRVKLGGSGAEPCPPRDCPCDAVLSHLSKSALLIVVSPTVATALGGTSLPQPVIRAPPSVRAARAKSAIRVVTKGCLTPVG